MARSGKRRPRFPRRFWAGRRISSRRETVYLFARRLATLLTAGMPLLRALELLARQERQARFRSILTGVSEAVRAGGMLSEGLRRHGAIFDDTMVSMLRAGEAGGNLAPVLDRLASMLEREDRTRKRVRAALVYPAIVIAVAAAVVALLLGLVVPQFETIFAELLRGAELPAVTRRVVAASHLVQTRPIALAAAAGLGWFTWRAGVRSYAGNRLRHRISLLLPGVGDLVRKSAIARMSRTLGSLLAGGAPMLEAIRIAGDVTGNPFIQAAVARIHDRVREGEALSGALARESIFPELLTGMIAVGEQSGSLETMLELVADHYDADVDRAVTTLTALVEPVMIVVLALVVGTIVIALFLPIITVMQGLAG